MAISQAVTHALPAMKDPRMPRLRRLCTNIACWRLGCQRRFPIRPNQSFGVMTARPWILPSCRSW